MIARRSVGGPVKSAGPTESPLVCLIIAAAAAEVSLGWILSLLHQLSLTTYAVLFFGAMAPVAYWMGTRTELLRQLAHFLARFRSRLRHPLPLLLYTALLLSFLGGVVYLPNNYDALTYRLPRLLDWWANHGWYWIGSADPRLNYSGAVQEWLFFPLVAMSKSDRLLFVVNALAFSLLPYLLFSIFTRLGIGPRVAWWWMWLLPLGMGILLQAGGIGNDLLSVFFFLAALDTALRYGVSRAPRLLFCSMSSIALCTGVKFSNLPLVLPWLVVVAPAGWGVLRRGSSLAAVVVLSLSVSILPTTVLNRVHTGAWAGDPANAAGLNLNDPLAGVVGNSVLIAANSLTPPALPFAGELQARLNDLAVFGPGSWLHRRFPRFEILLAELPQEESAGLGLLVTILFAWALVRGRTPTTAAPGSTRAVLSRRVSMCFFLACGLASLAFLAKLGSEHAARLFLPYSMLLVGCGLWVRDSAWLVRTRAWRVVSIAFGAASVAVLVLSPSRPLFPAGRALQAISGAAPRKLVERAITVYGTYAHRADLFAEVRQGLTAGDSVLGLVQTGIDLETSLWRPFGSRRVVHVLPGTTAEQLRRLGVRRVLISHAAMPREPGLGEAPGSWLSEGHLVRTYAIQQRARAPVESVDLIDISSAVRPRETPGGRRQ